MVCRYFGSCGGCVSQHVPYAAQVENKRARVECLLGKAGWSGDVKAVAGDSFGYRNRMDFIFHPGGLGLRERGNWQRIIDVARCPIANNGVNGLLEEARAWFEEHKKDLSVFDLKRQEGTLKHCLIRACSFTGDAGISFVMNEESSALARHVDLVRSFAESAACPNVAVAYVPRKSDVSVGEESFCVKGNPYLEERMGGLTFRYALQGFFQNNPVLALEMVRHVRGLLGPCFREEGTAGVLLDLFGGVGLFGISLAGRAKEVVIVESWKESVLFARENLAKNKVAGRAVEMDAKGIARLGLSPDVVITDPPRSGMPKEAVAWLLAKRPSRIIYVSCNPEELAKDLVRLAPSFVVSSAAVFDLFPQTNHVETVVELRRELR